VVSKIEKGWKVDFFWHKNKRVQQSAYRHLLLLSGRYDMLLLIISFQSGVPWKMGGMCTLLGLRG
jgi:hypothetical protein